MIRAFPVTAALLFILPTVVLGADLSSSSIYSGEELDQYEEVTADVLLRRIANGDDLSYNGVVVFGDLDLQSLDQPILSEIVLTNSKITGGINLDKATLLKKFDVNGSTFLGPSSFRCSKFEGGSDFSDCHFFQEANFGMSTFDNTAKFDCAQFDNIANFGGATFRNASFSRAKFSDICRFTDSHFIEMAGFHDGVVFNGYAEFENCVFFCDAFFSKAEFHEDVNFIRSNFNGDSFFNGVQFKEKVNFEDAKFQNAEFQDKVSFGEAVSFKSVSFGGNALFCTASFGGEADFREVNFSHNSSFSEADFRKWGRFDEAVFNDYLSLYHTDFNDLRIPWVNIKDHLVNDSGTYLNLMRNYGDLGWFKDLRGCYYQYRNLQRQNYSWRHDYLSKAKDTLAWFYGYGVRPFRAVAFMIASMILLIVLFAVIYYKNNGGIEKSRDIELKGDPLVFTLEDLGQSKFKILVDQGVGDEKTDFKDALSFSACTFVSCATGELSPKGICVQVARVERWIGPFLLGLLVAYLTNPISNLSVLVAINLASVIPNV